MRFSEEIQKINNNIAYERIFFDQNMKELYVVYPTKLAKEKILIENISRMTKVIREYIDELNLYSKCMRKTDEFYFDSQKQAMKNEAYEHQKRADELAEIMNEGISPYAWYYDAMQHGYIVCLDKI